MLVRDLVAVLEEIAPIAYAEAWDNVGLLAGDPAAEIDRVLFTIDLTRAVLDEAVAARAGAVVAYHPAIFAPLKRLAHDAPIVEAVKRGVAVYSPHTALDAAPGGTNDVLADVAGVRREGRSPLRAAAFPAASDVGMGRVGHVEPTTREALFARLRDGLGVQHLLVAGPRRGAVERVAVCAGSGGEMWRDALRARADVYVTGEMRHHDALAATEGGMTVVAALHSRSERVTLAHLEARCRELAAARGAAIATSRSVADDDPFTIV